MTKHPKIHLMRRENSDGPYWVVQGTDIYFVKDTMLKGYDVRRLKASRPSPQDTPLFYKSTLRNVQETLSSLLEGFSGLYRGYPE